jgi:uncharacterized protein (DUF362 family)
MKRISRRDFLRLLALSTGALTLNRILAACGLKPISNLPTENLSSNSPTNTIPPAISTEPPNSTAMTAATPLLQADLVVARGGEPEDLVRRAMAAFGGMETFVPKGANVVIKPNICVAYHDYKYAATTNPWVVGTLVKLCFEAGAGSVKVMDFPFGGTAQEAYKISGIKEQVETAGGEMAYMPAYQYVQVKIDNPLHLKSVFIAEEILKADVLINVPIAKHHSLARLTLGMKNLMGVVRDRPNLHSNIGQNLADLSKLVQPKLTVVDAVRILLANGPSGGNLDDVKQLDTVIVSPDIVAADSYAAALFGLRPSDVSYIKAGTEIGLGRSDLENLKIEEITVGA